MVAALVTIWHRLWYACTTALLVVGIGTLVAVFALAVARACGVGLG